MEIKRLGNKGTKELRRDKMEKQYSVKFKLEAPILALIYICYKYKFPASMMLTFYEMFERQSLFILKALSCTKKINLNDNVFIKIIEQSKILHKQIIAGISTNIKRNKLETLVKAGRKITETIPDAPEIDLTKFDDSDYREFITNYLQKNISDLFTTTPELKLDANDLYCELK